MTRQRFRSANMNSFHGDFVCDTDTALHVCPIRGTCVERFCKRGMPAKSFLGIAATAKAPGQSARLAMPIDCASLGVLPGMSPLHEGDRGSLDSRQVDFIRGSLSSPWGEHDARRHIRLAQSATSCETGQ